jgi:hypothetical protein
MLYQLQKTGYFWILIFRLNLNISDTLAYNFILRLFSEKKSKLGMKSKTQFVREKQRVLSVFEAFVRFRIDLEISSIMQPIHICLVILKVYPKKCLV